MNKLIIKLLIPACIILFGIAVFVFLTATKPKSETITIQERVWQVKTIPAQPSQLAPTLTLYGKVETPAMVKAAAPSKGRVMSIEVDEGDRISKGQVLLTLDKRDFQAKVAREQARVAELEAQIVSEKLHHKADKIALKHQKSLLNLQKAAVKRAQQLKDKNMGSTANLELAQQDLEKIQLEHTSRKLNLDDHDAQLRQIQARLDYAKAELELALLDLERSQVVAPFDGYVEKVKVSAGDQVTENQVLITFYPFNALEIRAKIPAAYQHELQSVIDQDASLSAQVQSNAKPIPLTLDRLSGAADTRGIDALFKINEANGLLRLGSTVSLIMNRPSHSQAVIIPFSALYDNDRIYVIEQNRLKGIRVRRLGEFQDRDQSIKLLINSPELKSGDKIVVTQLPNAVTGMAVNESSASVSNF